jgi:zinc protease
MAFWHIQESLYPMPHPYHWMTIGSQEDLDAASLEDVKSFFRRFYSPSNASLAVAGNYQRDDALELINRYFGDLPPGPSLPRMGRRDSALAGRVELEMRDRVSLPRLYIAWPTPPDMGPYDAPLDLLQGILADGLSSRLHRRLVYEKQIAQSAAVRYHPGEIGGQFVVQITAAADRDLAEVEAATDDELKRVHSEPPTEEEITRVKNRIEASHYRQLARIGGFGGRADQLNHFSVMAGDPGLINSSLDRYLAVQRDDILRASEAILDHRQVRLRVFPEPTLKPAVTSVDRSIMPVPAVAPEFTPPTPLRRRLSNGMGISVVERRGLPIVGFALLLRAGATNDPQELPGLASFTAQMLAEGTEGRTSQDIAAAFEFIGARVSTDARRECTLLSTETMSRHWPAALELVADLVKRPTFPEHELERLRREHLTDLRRAKDDPTAVAERLISSLVFDRGSGYGHYILGTEAAVAALAGDDVKRQFRRGYGPALATLIVVGDVSADEVVEQAEAHLGDWTGDPEFSPVAFSNLHGVRPAATIYLVDQPGAAQSVIRAIHATIPRNHPDYFGLTLVNHAFGGQFSARLNQNLRQDKGYSYGYQSTVHWYHGPSLLLAGGSVQTEVTKESVQETLREFHDIHASRPISQGELQTAKEGILQGYPASFERPGMVLSHLIQLVLFDLPDDYFQTVESGIDSVSLAEARRIAAESIQPDGLQVLVVGDREKVESGLRDLGLPLVLLDTEGAGVD